MRWLDASQGKTGCDAADFLDRPSDEVWRLRVRLIRVFGGGGALARQRMVASMAKASITSETWRCQPCQERLSLWSKPRVPLHRLRIEAIAATLRHGKTAAGDTPGGSDLQRPAVYRRGYTLGGALVPHVPDQLP